MKKVICALVGGRKFGAVVVMVGLVTGLGANGGWAQEGVELVTTTGSVEMAEAPDAEVTTVTAVGTSSTLGTTLSAGMETAALPSKVDEPTSVSVANGGFFQVLTEGSGPVAATTQTIYLHYTLYLADGSKVESSRDLKLPLPLQLVLGQGTFIPGAEAGLKGMRKGEVRRIFVPSDQGYGEKGNEGVPPNADLVFEMEAVDIR